MVPQAGFELRNNPALAFSKFWGYRYAPAPLPTLVSWNLTCCEERAPTMLS